MLIVVYCVAVFAAFILMRLVREISKTFHHDSNGADLMLAEIGRKRLDFS